MDDCLIDHYRSQKRQAYVISLHSYDGAYTLEEVLSTPDKVVAQLETELLLHDLATQTSHQQMAVVHMRSAGYNMREIANGSENFWRRSACFWMRCAMGKFQRTRHKF